MYLVDRHNLGGYNAKQDSSVQSFLAAFSTPATVKAQEREGPQNAAKGIHKGQEHHRVQTTMVHKQMQIQSQQMQSPQTQNQPMQKDAEISNIHSAPVFWRSAQSAHVYIWGEVDVLKAFPVDSSRRVSPKAW